MTALITQDQAIGAYGNPGTHQAKPLPGWVKANIVGCGWNGKAELPAMPGVPPHLWFAVHREVEPAMRQAFAAAHAAAPGYQIGSAGCWVFRHQRHDVARPLSLHSWGIAVDVDAGTNAGRELDHPPEPWSKAWLALWPHGLPRAFVEAFESHGFAWGGRWHGYVDPMHFQIAAP